MSTHRREWRGRRGSDSRPLPWLIRAMVSFRLVSQTLGRFIVSPKPEDLVVLREFIDAGRVTPVIDRTYLLSETPQAIDHVGGGHARGKS